MRHNGYRTTASLVGLVAAVALVVGAGSARAAETTRIEGNVVDPDGNGLAKVGMAFVQIKDGKGEYKLKSKKGGRFLYPFLPWRTHFGYTLKLTDDKYKLLKVTLTAYRSDRPGDVLLEFDQVIGPNQEVPVIDTQPGGSVKMEVVVVEAGDYNNALAEATGQPKPVERKVTTSSSGSSSRRGKDPVGRARKMAEDGDRAGAIALLTSQTESSPDDVEVFYNLGKFHFQDKDYAAAVTALQRASELNADKPGVHYYLGASHGELEQYPQAVAAFEKERVNSPDNATVVLYLAQTNEYAGNSDAAKKYYAEVLELDPASVPAAVHLVGLYAKEGDFEQSRKYASYLEGKGQEAALAFYNMGVVAQNQGNWDQAVEMYEQALTADPAYAQAHVQLGYANVARGESAAAVTHFEKYLELQPNASDSADIRDFISQLR